MLPKSVRRIIYTLTLVAWAVLVVSATPLPFVPTPEQRSLATLIACVGSLKWLVRRMFVPAVELYCAGKTVGRAEALAEIDDEDVVSLDERRALRVVTGGPTAGGGH